MEFGADTAPKGPGLRKQRNSKIFAADERRAAETRPLGSVRDVIYWHPP